MWSKFSKILGNFEKICINQQNFQRFLNENLSLENGAKECIVRPPPGDPTIYEVADVHLAVIFLS